MEGDPKRVMLVSAHPGDSEYWCGGTIARWVANGASVHHVLCTEGERGTGDIRATSEEIASIRQGEHKEASRILGVQESTLLHRSDGGLEDCAGFRKEIVRLVRQVRPDIVLCPEPYRRNLAWHRDHRVAGQVTLDAVFPCARDHLHFAELWEEEGLEPHKTGTVWFWGAEQPDVFVDITATIEAKVRAVLAHRSQLVDLTNEEAARSVKERAERTGAGRGLGLAEAFREVTFRT